MNAILKLLFLTVLFAPAMPAVSQTRYPPNVLAALSQTKTNQAELKKALNYFYNTGDELKIKSINFLVANMPVHNTISYYWADDKGHRISYNELDYPTFNDAVIALDALKRKYGTLNPVPYKSRDIDNVTAKYLITNIEQSCNAWRLRSAWLKKRGQSIEENDFLEYVLPYRVAVEEITNWKDIYNDRFKNSFTSNFYNDSIRLHKYINDNFKNLFNYEVKAEPLPRLSALQILLRRKGLCEDMADMAVFAARSNGIPATIDNIPAWATSSGGHYTNYLRYDNKNHYFDSALDSMEREPGKVLRSTYSIQAGTLATWLDTSQIPFGFLQLKNYIDVTNQYWKTGEFTINLFPNTTSKAVYVGVMNGGRMVPVWFAKKQQHLATFRNMSKGVVYFPFYFENHTVVFAGYPFALGYHNQVELKPDLIHKHTVKIQAQDKYLKYRPGKRYQLLVWDNQWKLHSEQVAPTGCTQLVFSNVPQNALLLLRPEYSEGKERPFTVLQNGERIWW